MLFFQCATQIDFLHIAQDSVKLTISLGVAELEKSGGSLEMLLDYAEKACLQAKQNGRNQVQVYPAR